jgi:hypothetical protein
VYPEHVEQVGQYVRHVVSEHVDTPVSGWITPHHPSTGEVTTHPGSVVYVKGWCSVGKKFILLDACSILRVYRGIGGAEGKLPAHATVTQNARAAPTAARVSHFCRLSMVSLPLNLYYLCRRSFKSFAFIPR